MSASPILELNNISKTFGGVTALENVNFNLFQGETHALVGENGAGKSTLMKILSGVYNEFDGDYVLDGEPIRFSSPADALHKGIGMIHQELSVMPSLSVAENVFLGRQLTTPYGAIDWKRMEEIAKEELLQLGFDIDVRQSLERYSLGTQQVVEVLRVILSGARVLIMDEPTSSLSPAEVDRLLELVHTLKNQNRSVIYISHFLEEVMQVADRVTVLRNGQHIDTLGAEQLSIDTLISLILGREAGTKLPAAAQTRNEKVLLEVTDMSADAFRNINLTVGAGEIVGVYGAIGAGHFPLARAIYGLYRVDSGQVTVDGHPFPSRYSARYAIDHGIAYAIESRRKSLFLDKPNYENITLPNLARIAALVPNKAKEVAIADAAMEQVHVHPHDPVLDVGKLSGGNQQKVAIARWLTHPPKVFIVSEPTRGMDVGAKNEVLSILRRFRNEGFGVLVVSSEPETVLSVSDRIIVMSRGNMVAEMEKTEDVDKDTLMRLL